MKEKEKFVEWILLALLMIMMHFNYISLAESIIIYMITIGLEYILIEIQKIRELLEKLNYTPFHVNCRHSINTYVEDEEDKD